MVKDWKLSPEDAVAFKARGDAIVKGFVTNLNQNVMMEMLCEAIEFAAMVHFGQTRKGTMIPYIFHPISVGKILIDVGCDTEIVAAGVLHDTVEDTRNPAVNLEAIEKKFTKRVARLVEGASEPQHKTDSWETRKEHTIEALRTAPEDVLMVVLADKLDNIRSIRLDYKKHGDALWERFNRGKEKQQWYYESLAKVFQSRAVNAGPIADLTKELTGTVIEVFRTP